MNKHSRTHKKALGAYYTPLNLSKVLCEWALRTSNDKILEPSFGGCGFLEASIERLLALGCKGAELQLFGADIDPAAFDFLSKKIKSYEGINDHFLYKDFLKVSPDDFRAIKFDIVLGNPPYVSMHNMTEEQKKNCFELLKNTNFADDTIGRNASLWAFFLLHSLSFIKKGGRSAWVLPSSLLHADYANAVLNIFSQHFSLVKVVKLNERFFQEEEADEISVILFADGFVKERKPPTAIGFTSIYGLKELEELCRDLTLSSIISTNYKSTVISEDASLAFNRIKATDASVPLGSISKVVIGMVTGDNKTFIIDKNTVQKNGIKDEDLKPVVGRFSMLQGLIHTEARHKKAQNENQKAYLVCPENIILRNTNIRKYLSRVSKKDRQNNKTFHKRAEWYYPDDRRYPDAFLTYMIHRMPRLVINLAKITCTNSIHRVFFNNGITLRKRKAIAISMLSSFSQLSAEMEGRAYGSGVLKLEPSAAKKIQILITPELEVVFTENAAVIEKLISQNLFDDAQKIIDELISKTLEIPNHTMNLFSVAVEQLREERYSGLNKNKIYRA